MKVRFKKKFVHYAEKHIFICKLTISLLTPNKHSEEVFFDEVVGAYWGEINKNSEAREKTILLQRSDIFELDREAEEIISVIVKELKERKKMNLGMAKLLPQNSMFEIEI